MAIVSKDVGPATATPNNNLYLPNGETPLSALDTTDWAKYIGEDASRQGNADYRGGGIGAANFAAQQAFANMFGRQPSAQELAQLAPAFQSADPNKLNVAGGNSQIAAYYQQQANTPQNIYQQQQSQYLAAAPQYADQVNQIFQSQLGRDATADEKTHFGALVASGQDPYQIQQALQQTQEYQNTQNTNFQNTLQNQLQGSNATYFNNYIAPGLQAQAANAGRSLDSSGVNSALASAALQQNQGLQQFLAGVTAQNYGNSTANATAQYNNLESQQYGLQNAGVSNALSNQTANTQYNQQLNNFQLQQQAYNNYLSNYGKKSNGLGGLVGGLVGAGAGAYFGGSTGASAGYQIGSGVGNAAQGVSSGGKL